MSLSLTILGFNSALPTRNSHPSAQYLQIGSNHFLIDCGEGTQVQMRRAGIKFSKINQIFISHLHGDHVFGLIGLISTFQLLGREKPLQIFGPDGIRDFLFNQLKHTGAQCLFELDVVEINPASPNVIYEDNKVEVQKIPLNHRILTYGYLFKEKAKLKHLNMAAVEKYKEIETCDYQNLKLGKDFELENGEIISNNELTHPASASLSFAYCSDTRYSRQILPIIKAVDLLYHESTFLTERADLAEKTGHSTAAQAGMIAKQAEVKHLILGHFSNRYRDYTPFLLEAKEEFESTHLPQTLATFELDEQGKLELIPIDYEEISSF